MNLIEFHEKISSNTKKDYRLFSEEVTIFNILNGLFTNLNTIDISVSNDSSFMITLESEDIAKATEDILQYKIIPGGYDPMYQVLVTRNNTSLYINLIEV